MCSTPNSVVKNIFKYSLKPVVGRAGRYIDIFNTGIYKYIVTEPGYFFSTEISLKPR